MAPASPRTSHLRSSSADVSSALRSWRCGSLASGPAFAAVCVLYAGQPPARVGQHHTTHCCHCGAGPGLSPVAACCSRPADGPAARRCAPPAAGTQLQAGRWHRPRDRAAAAAIAATAAITTASSAARQRTPPAGLRPGCCALRGGAHATTAASSSPDARRRAPQGLRSGAATATDSHRHATLRCARP